MKASFILNLAPNYNRDLIIKLDQLEDVNFIIGDHYKGVRSMNISEIQSTVTVVKNIWLLKEFYFQKIPLKSLPKSGIVIITGDFYCLSNWLLILYFRIRKIKVHLWTHGLYGNEKALKLFLKKMFYKFSNGLFLYSERAFNLMKTKGYLESEMLVVYNSLNQPQKSHQRLKIFKNNLPVVFYLGRITKSKKLDYLLSSFNEINNQQLSFNLLLIGDLMDDSIDLEEYKSGKLGDYIFHLEGIYDELELSKYFNYVDLAVVPGNIGLFLLHCLNYGIPVVTHDKIALHGPEIELLEPHVNGLFYEYKNLDSLNNAILQGLRMSFKEQGKLFKRYNAQSQYEIISKFINENN